MKRRLGMLILALLVISATAVIAQAQSDSTSAHMGTWKLNEAKSRFGKGATKNTSVVYESAGDQIKVTVDGTDGSGAAVHTEWTGKFDGKPYALTGDATVDMRSYRVVNKRTLSLRHTKGGKLVSSGTIVVSANGKTRTVTTSGKDAQGRTVTSTAVYDKQ